MNSILRHVACQVLIVVGTIAFSSLAGAGLIEPSRGLDDRSSNSGRVWVFSEPPGLSVLINGKNAGLTPIIDLEIGVGEHLVQVQNESTKIFVLSNSSLRLSFFRGQFLMIPEKEMGPTEAASSKHSPPSAPNRVDPNAANPNRTNDFFWPINPRGPIY